MNQYEKGAESVFLLTSRTPAFALPTQRDKQLAARALVHIDSPSPPLQTITHVLSLTCTNGRISADHSPLIVQNADVVRCLILGWIGICEVRVLKDQRLKTPFP